MSTRTREQDSWFAGVLSAVTTAVLVLALALAVAVAVVPRLLGGAALTVLSGSMEPTYSPGDMIVVRGVEDPAREVKVGDVVTFQPVSGDPTLVTHRVVEKTFVGAETRFITRGDANGADDDPLKPEQIMGTVVYAIPLIGYLAVWVGDFRGPIVTVVAIALILYGAFQVLRPTKRRTPAPDPALENEMDPTRVGQGATR